MAKVTTFYSYKGGSGRSMTMANVAWALATNGEKVLAIDWDLEAPGLHRYFHPFLKDPEQARSAGLVDRIWEYIGEMGSAGHQGREGRFRLAHCGDLVQELDLPSRSKGFLHLLGAGRQDDQYSAKVGGLDWAGFYARFDGEAFITSLMDWARGRYTHILIDSRTGVADTAGICTAQLPDAVVMCVVYNRQSIEGSAAVARSIHKTRRERDERQLNIRFIPCRVEERGAVEAARRFAALRLGRALDGVRGPIERELRRNEIRHYPWCAFEEKLAVFEDVPDERGSLLEAMHDLATQIAGRKTLTIKEIDPKILASIWRRAAFDDPRIADLEALEEASREEASSYLLLWVDEALANPDERPDWLMALAEAAVSLAGRSYDRHGSEPGDFLANSGLELGGRAFTADREQFSIRFALLLQAVSAHLQRSQKFEDAFSLASRSYDLLLQEGSPVSHWRAARSLERMAEISLSNGNPEGALSIYRDVAELYASIDRRGLPIGAGLDPARSLRLLAEQLLAHGEPAEAERTAEEAVRALRRANPTRSRHDAAELVNILATRAEIAGMVGSDNAENAIAQVRRHAGEVIESPTARSQLERRLLIATARLWMRRGNFDAALSFLDGAADLGEPTDAASGDLFDLRIDILLGSGRAEEAVRLMERAMRGRQFFPSLKFVDQFRRALAATGREDTFTAGIMGLLADGESVPPVVMNRAVQWLISEQSKRGAQDGSPRRGDADPESGKAVPQPSGKVRNE